LAHLAEGYFGGTYQLDGQSHGGGDDPFNDGDAFALAFDPALKISPSNHCMSRLRGKIYACQGILKPHKFRALKFKVSVGVHHERLHR